MPNIAPQYFRDFSGGEGDALYYGPKGGFRAGIGLDTLTIENGFKIAQQLQNPIFGATEYFGQLQSVNPHRADTFATWGRPTNAQHGTLYSGNQTPLILSTTPTAYNKIMGWGRMHRPSDNAEVDYAFTDINTAGLTSGLGKIHRIDTDYEGMQFSIGEFELGENRTTLSDKLPVLSLPGRIIFAYGNSIFEIDDSQTVQRLLVLPASMDIQNITVYLDSFKIYATRKKSDGTNADGYIAYWDGISATVEQYVYYENSPIRLVMPNGESDIVVFGGTFTADLYQVQGLQRVLLRSNVESLLGNTRAFGKTGDTREDIVYFTGKSKFGDSCLYSLGGFYPGSPNQLCPGIQIPYELQDIKAVKCEDQYIDIYVDFAGTGDNGRRFRQNLLQNGTDGTNAKIVLYPIIGDGLSREKQLKDIYIGYNLRQTNNEIKIYYRKGSPYKKDINAGWTLLDTITGDINIRHKRITGPQQTTGYFYELEIMIELVRLGGSQGPILHEFDVEFIDNLKK